MKVGMHAGKAVAALAAGVIAGMILRQVYLARRAARIRRQVPRQQAAAPGVSTHDVEAAEATGNPPLDRSQIKDPGAAAASATPKRRRRNTQHAQPVRRSGQRTPGSLEGLTKQQLYLEARKRNIRGRSTMTKAELLRALRQV